MPTEKRLSMEILRHKNQLGIKIKIPEELEELFEEMSDQTVRSEVWQKDNGEGQEFYKINQEYQEIEDTVTQRTFNDYGQGLFRSNKINLAPLRTKGASEGVEIYASAFSGIGKIEFRDYMNKLGRATKRIAQKFIQDKKVKATMKITI